MPRTILPDPRRSPRFAGLTTFGRYPRLEDLAPENAPPDWIVHGVPFDAGVTYRPGARFGPRAIRAESQYLKRYHVPFAIDVCDALSIADAGDAPILPYDLKPTLDAARDWAQALPAPSRLLALGGDHTIAFANIAATHARLGSPAGGLALIHFDSHLDTVDVVWGEQWGHGSVFRRAIEAGLIDPRAMVSAGIKGPLNRADDLDYARQVGATILMRDQATPEALARALAPLRGRPVYLTFDIDAVDPAFAPGTGTPSVGGFTSAEALALLRTLRGLDIVGADVVEVLPDRDPGGITALLAAHIAFEILALDADRRHQGAAASAGPTHAR